MPKLFFPLKRYLLSTNTSHTSVKLEITGYNNNQWALEKWNISDSLQIIENEVLLHAVPEFIFILPLMKQKKWWRRWVKIQMWASVQILRSPWHFLTASAAHPHHISLRHIQDDVTCWHLQTHLDVRDESYKEKHTCPTTGSCVHCLVSCINMLLL